nr:MAG TPA: baseplate wedge protein [Caudoviricetes sp.]
MGTIITYNSDNVGKVNKLGITSQEHRNRAYEPQTQNTFTFQFLFDPGQVAYIATLANKTLSPFANNNDSLLIDTDYNKGLASINNILNHSLQSITSPTKNIGQIVIDFFNTQVKFAGKPTYTNANITLNTLIGLGSKNVLAAWADMCLSEKTLAGGWARSLQSTVNGSFNQQGGMSDDEYLNYLFPLIGYKCDGLLLECARDGTVVNQWEYIGMWISSFTPGSYTMAGANTPSQVTGTITVDLIKQSDTSFVKSNVNY